MTFPEPCFYHNPVTITILPRVKPFFVLSHLCFRDSRSLFIFPVTRTNKKNSTTTSTSMSHFPHGVSPRCPWCSIKLPKWKCSHCPSRDKILKMQKDRLNEQETKLFELRDLQLENKRLRREYQRLRQKHEELRIM
jgi:hypothetical protein